MLNFNHLHYFHATVTEGSIKAAADRLGVTQPTVSEQLRVLERTLGVELFERTPSGLKLTLAGREASEHAAAIFLAGERLVKALTGATRPPPLPLRVGVSVCMSRTIAADFLLPVLTVDESRPSIRTGEFHELLRCLRTRELDLVVGETEPVQLMRAGLEVELVCRPELVAVSLPGADARDDWNKLSLLEYRTSSVFRWEVDTYLNENNLSPKLAGDLDDAFLMLEAVLRGGFVGFVPWSIAGPAIRTGKVKVLATLKPKTAGIYAVYLTARRYSWRAPRSSGSPRAPSQGRRTVPMLSRYKLRRCHDRLVIGS